MVQMTAKELFSEWKNKRFGSYAIISSMNVSVYELEEMFPDHSITVEIFQRGARAHGFRTRNHYDHVWIG